MPRRNRRRNRKRNRKVRSTENSTTQIVGEDIERNPGEAPDAPSDESHRSLAAAYIEDNAYEQAAKQLQQLERCTDRDRLTVGICFAKSRQWKAARQSLELTLDHGPNPESLYWFAVALAEGKREEGLEAEIRAGVLDCLTEATQLPGCCAEAYTWLLRIRRSEREQYASLPDEDFELLRRGVAVNPESATLRLKLARELIKQKENYSEAEAVIGPLLFLESPPPEACWLQYRIHCNAGRWQLAHDSIDVLKTVSKPPEQGPGFDMIRGDLLYKAGDPESALEAWTTECQRDDPEAKVVGWLRIAGVQFELGDSDNAIAAARVAIDEWRRKDRRDNQFYPGHGERFQFSSVQGYYQFAPSEDDLYQSLRSVDAPAAKECRAGLLHLSYRLGYGYEPQLLHDSLEEHLHPHIGADIADDQIRRGNLKAAVHYHLLYAEWCVVSGDGDISTGFFSGDFDQYGSRKSLDEVLDSCEDVAEASQIATQFLSNVENVDVLVCAIYPFYETCWRTMIHRCEAFADMVAVTERLLTVVPDHPELLFDHAFALNRTGHVIEGAESYSKLLQLRPDDTSALHNLSLIKSDIGDVKEAADLSARAAEIAPDDELFVKNARRCEQLLEERLDEERRADEFLRTAPQRWPQLDYYKRQLLSALTVITGFDDWEHLARLSGVGEQYLQGHWRKLVDLGMIVEDDSGQWRVNEHVTDLIKRERSHAVVTKIIHAEPEIAYKPIFNSKQEYTFYNVLLGLFPNQLVLPNMGLQAVFQYSRMKQILDSDDFGYYLRAQVDCCITSTSNYLPVIGFEFDSRFHDEPDQQERDERKNRIFQQGGVPLLRIRPHGNPTPEAIRAEIIRAVRSLGEQLRKTDASSGHAVNIQLEVDFEHFGSGSYDQ